ncbi:fructose-specific PTS transporter subunit EIIC [Streptomyces sp. NPDC004111]|uniref:fructose-specific PTS transporter subunit EIIC n=1 Tax=Streptomyces sp. NPDC004111 TaxID=3364690 RepID=UPI0036A21CDF
MTSPAVPPGNGDTGGRRPAQVVAVTACPAGIAHTYMAAERLQQAADRLGVRMKVETQGSIGAENVLSDNDVAAADGVIIAADKEVDRERFAGKPVLSCGVADGIHRPEELIARVTSAPVQAGEAAAAGAGEGRERSQAYKALMNGVSHMIPFVVVGGLLLALSIALGGHTTPKGIEFDQGSFWFYVNSLGGLGFKLMLPVFSGYIAHALGDRPALVPGMIGGFLAADGVGIYGAEANAGFLGAIATGFLAGYLVVWIKKVKVPAFVRPVMPIIVIPIVSTLVLGLAYIYVLGQPISWVFTHLTDWLNGMTGSSAIVLGALIGLMVAFDMGGPVNKTAFLVAVGLIGTNNHVMGMAAAAIPVMPLGQGLATVLRRKLYSGQERETGIAALFMGFFGISEGAIPFAAARPAQVIPANMLGGAVAGAVAGLAGVENSVPHGGPIVALFGAIGNVALFFVAMALGVLVTALATNALIEFRIRRNGTAPVAAGPAVPEPVLAEVGAPAASGGTAARAVPTSPEPTAKVLSGYVTGRTVRTELAANTKEAAIRELAQLLAADGGVRDVDTLVRAVLAREEQGTTGLGESIAIPHAKTDAVSRPTVAFARSGAGIEWGAPDATAAHLIFMIAVPQAAAGDEHLRILALLSRRLMDAGFRERLRSADDEPAVLAVLAEIH